MRIKSNEKRGVKVIEKSVGAIVVGPNGKYLLLNRPDKEGDFWEFPKGHQARGEIEEKTLRRELSEEVGIRNFSYVGKFVGENRYVNSAGNMRIIRLYMIKVQSDKIALSDEHKSYVWMSLGEAIEKLNHDTWRRILKDADKTLKNT